MTRDGYDKQAPRSGTPAEEQMSYGDYLCLDRLLSAQRPRSAAHDEMLFVIQHQTTELWMKLVIHELRAAIGAIRADRLQFASKTLVRVGRILAQMNDAWDVLRTMTPIEFVRFRESLQQSSGFQSYQYRTIEFLAGNRNAALLHAHAGRPDIGKQLADVLGQPSLYDETLLLLARRGHDIGADARRTDWRATRVPNEQVLAAWQAVYAANERDWLVYDLAERLVDLEDYLRRWRFNHVTTVERIIGMKRGTGSTAGVPYLRRLLDVVLFAELWSVRTRIESADPYAASAIISGSEARSP
jgi:tryptophan 2,3-dioxygenase